MDLDEYIDKNKGNANFSIQEIAKETKASVPTIYRHLKMKGVKPKRVYFDKRIEEINKMRSEGKTYQEIGNIYGISRQRVEQIINGYN